MIRVPILIVVMTVQISYAQSINFNSYANVSNAEFRTFLGFFEQKNLPVSTDIVLSEVSFAKLKTKPGLTQHQIDKYLTDNGKLIPGPIYTEVPDESEPVNPVVGEFYPLYKLPTSGNYALLVFAQVGPAFECNNQVIVLSYDLEGNFLYVSNHLYRGGTENLNNYIDVNLQSHRTYVVNEVNGKLETPPMTGTFPAKEAHMIYQINPDGRSTRVSFETVQGQFQFSGEECRFKRVN